MRLSVLERLLLLNLLPKEGSFTNLKLLRIVRESLSFNEEENKVLGFRQENDKIFWNEKTVDEKEIEIGEVVSKLIVKALEELNNREGLIEGHISLYEKFVEAK